MVRTKSGAVVPSVPVEEAQVPKPELAPGDEPIPVIIDEDEEDPLEEAPPTPNYYLPPTLPGYVPNARSNITIKRRKSSLASMVSSYSHSPTSPSLHPLSSSPPAIGHEAFRTPQTQPPTPSNPFPPTFSLPLYRASTSLAASALHESTPLVRVERVCRGCAGVLRRAAGVGVRRGEGLGRDGRGVSLSEGAYSNGSQRSMSLGGSDDAAEALREEIRLRASSSVSSVARSIGALEAQAQAQSRRRRKSSTGTGTGVSISSGSSGISPPPREGASHAHGHTHSPIIPSPLSRSANLAPLSTPGTGTNGGLSRRSLSSASIRSPITPTSLGHGLGLGLEDVPVTAGGLERRSSMLRDAEWG